MQSLTESFTACPEPTAAWALLELHDAIGLRLFGRDPFAICLDAAGSRRCPIPQPRRQRRAPSHAGHLNGDDKDE